MIYFVSSNQQLFKSQYYSMMSIEEALYEISSWDVIQFDTETSGRNPHLCKILCAQFGNKTRDMQIVVDCTTTNLLLFKNVLESKLIIGQNLKFDLQFLYNYYIIPTKIWDTMIAEQVLFLGYDPKYFHVSLKAIAERRLNIDIDKTTRGEIIWRGLDDKVILYAAGDVQYLEDIRDQQLEEAIKKNNIKAIELENAFVPCCAYLEWCGIKLDVDKWRKDVIVENQKNLQKAEAALNKWVVNKYKSDKNTSQKEVILKVREDNHGYTETYNIPKDCVRIGPEIKQSGMFGIVEYYQKFRIRSQWNDWVKVNLQGDIFSGFDTEPKCIINWSSSKQLIPFFQYLGFSTKAEDKKTGATKESITEKVISKQKGIADDFLEIYFAYKEAEKVCSTYGENYIDAINPITGRIHTTFKQIGASSSRMSCGGGIKTYDTDLAKYKGIIPSRCKFVQIQNLPHDAYVRECFIPEKDNLMVSSDYSALESRLGADIYNEPKMIEEFLYGSGDIHSLTAKACFPEELEGIEVKDIKKLRPDLRQKAKGPEFACQFEIYQNFLNFEF